MTQAGPSAQIADQQKVRDFHVKDDCNSSDNAHHHMLGRSSGKASPGMHNHDGINSESLLEGVSLSGSRAANTADIIRQIAQALVLLGVTDNTVA